MAKLAAGRRKAGKRQQPPAATPDAAGPPAAAESAGEAPRRRKRRAAEAEELAAAAAPGAAAARVGEPAAEGAAQAGRKRKLRAAQAEEAAAAGAAPEGAAPAGVAGEAAPRKRKRRAPREAEEEAGGEARETAEEAAGEEEKRRAAQREIQQLVVRLRAEGKSEAEIRAAKEELRAKHGGLRKPDGRAEMKRKAWKEWLDSGTFQEQRAQERTERLQRKHELVVIPVIWRGRHDHQEVLRAAEDVKACVAQQGVDVWLDARRHYTPGQKFAHWEHRGVMLRVEVGPEDLKEGVCRVCRAKAPGEYKSVERKRLRLPPAGARALLLTLKEWGLSKIEVERRPEDDKEEEEEDNAEAEGSAGGAAAAAAASGLGDVEGNWAPRAPKEPAGKAKKAKKHKGRKKPRRVRRGGRTGGSRAPPRS